MNIKGEIDSNTIVVGDFADAHRYETGGHRACLQNAYEL